MRTMLNVLGLFLVVGLIACGSPSTAAVDGVTINEGNQSLIVGETVELTADVATTGSADDGVTWSSSDDAVATVNEDGLVTAEAAGETTITATSTADDTKSDSITVTVVTSPEVVSVTIDQSDTTLEIGTDTTLTVTVVTAGTIDDSVSWSSSDEAVATVDADGTVTAEDLGDATITATSTEDASKSDSIVVTVEPGPGPFELSVSEAFAEPGDVVTLTFPEFISMPTITFDGVEADVVTVLTLDAHFAVTELDVVVPEGVVGYADIEVDDGSRTATLDGEERLFFAGTDATAVTTLSELQDALDAAKEGSAILLDDVAIDGTGASLVVDNRVVFGAPEGATSITNLDEVDFLVYDQNVAGLVDLTITADDYAFHDGRINEDAIGILSWPPSVDDPAQTTSQGTFVFSSVVLTGSTVSEPTVNDDTLAISTFGAATGAMDTPATLASYVFHDATVRLDSIDMNDTDAIGSWTFVDSDVWAQNGFYIRQRTGDLTVDGSRLMLAGDPSSIDYRSTLEYYVDSFTSRITDSEFSSTSSIDVDHDDGGNRTILRSHFRAVDDLDFQGDNIGDITVEDSTFIAVNGSIDFETEVGRIDMLRTVMEADGTIQVEIDEGGFLTIVDADWTSHSDRIHIYMDRGGDIDIDASTFTASDRVHVEIDNAGSATVRDSTFTSSGYVYFEMEEGNQILSDLDITATTYVEFEVGDAGDMLLQNVTVNAGTYIDFYNDYYGTIRVEDSSLTAGSYIDVDPWSSGVIQVTFRDTTLTAREDVEFHATTGGDTLLERVSIESKSGAILLGQGSGILTVADSDLVTLGEVHPSDGGWISDHAIEIASERNVTTVSGTTIAGVGPLRLLNDDERPDLDGGAGANHIKVQDNPSITVDGDIEMVSFADLLVTDNPDIAAGGAIDLTATYGLVDTSGSTFTPAPTIDGATTTP